MIDTHCHLADRKFAHDLDAVILRARTVGVGRMVTIGDSMEESRACVKIAEKHPDVFCAVGVHPHHAKEWVEGDREQLRAMVEGFGKVRAIGEIGLDYHYDPSRPLRTSFPSREDQKLAFEDQLVLVKEINISAVVHNRESLPDLLAIINRVVPPALVLHCCTERWKDVKPLVEKGYLLSFTGMATYPSAGDVRETIKQCPLEQMMLETDAPYLAPVPHRRERNEPAFVTEVAKLVAKIKSLAVEEVDRVTTVNAVRFFGL